MGDGKKLKEYVKSKGTSVRRIAKATGIPATTLYSIIQKDSNIRIEYALPLASALGVDVHEIYTNGLDLNTIQNLSCKWKQNLDSHTVKSYVINSFYPLLYLFGEEKIPDVHKFLTSFYQLDDEARAEVVEMVRIKLEYHQAQMKIEEFRCLQE